jgi:hypothetical protein
MIASWLSKLTNSAMVRVAILALAFSPAIGLANTPAKVKGAEKQITLQPPSHRVQFQGQPSAADWDHDSDGFYKPTRSPGFHDLFGS